GAGGAWGGMRGDQGIHRALEATSVTRLGEQLLCAIGIVRRNLPVGAVALVERIVIVGERRLGAFPLPEGLDDRLLVHREIHGQPDLAAVLPARRIRPVTLPRTARTIV